MRHDPGSTREGFLTGILNTMKAHYGPAVKAYWVYDDDLCPCCRTRKIDVMDYQGKKAMSFNAFMYRELGVLIGYMMCGRCGKRIIAQTEEQSADMHSSIEESLKDAYLRHLNSMDA